VRIRDVARELDPDKREYFGLQGRQGAFVENVTPGLPAAQAGLKRGDAIVSVDGQSLNSSDDLIHKISSKAPGEKVKIGIIRDGREQTIVTELADRAELDTGIRRAGRDSVEEAPPVIEENFNEKLGFMVHEMNPTLRGQFRVDDELKGVIVVHVDKTSQAWDKGLHDGDVVVEINKRPVEDLKSYRAAIDGMEPGSLANLYVVSPGGQGRYVTIRTGGE